LLIFGILSLIGAASALFLPETVNQPLPQTLKDGNDLGRGQRKLSCCVERAKTTKEKYQVEEKHSTLNAGIDNSFMESVE
jgi:hypothetical protein